MYKVLFHIELDDTEPLKVAFANIKNLLKEIDEAQCDIELVANYKGPLLFLRKNIDIQMHNDIIQLSKIGVKFLMCNNSLNNLRINKDDLIKEAGIVSAGILEIVKRQSEGYAYIRT